LNLELLPKNTLCKIIGAAGLQLSLQNPLILFRELMQSSFQTLFADRRQKIETLALSPDGQWNAAGTRQGIALIWDWPSQSIRHCINVGLQHNLLRSNQHDGRQVHGKSPPRLSSRKGTRSETLPKWDITILPN
jgi:hypothetical protein